ncbi:MAG TPA: cell division protein FtsZ [Candidatus Limnocylindrales bacterium]|nr:cell division protein FtsZ [Candidatus Limnocylindrales bacterium]
MDPIALTVVKVVLFALVGLVIARVVFLGMPGAARSRRARTIRVVGVGGGGGNAVDAMIRARTRGVEFIACNTDAQALAESHAEQKVQIGAALTDGLGAGGDPSIGQQAAREDAARIERALEGSDIVFVTAGLGGGTGSGAASVVAGIARDAGALTIGVVTKPFDFEGPRRRSIAEDAAADLRTKVDALITVPNDRVRGIVPDGATMPEAFGVVDDVLRESVQAIIDLIGTPGLVNLDFADVRALLRDAGPTVMGVGRAAGENRVVEATRRAMASGLLEDRVEGATRVLLNVAGSSTLSLRDVSTAADTLRAVADPQVNITFGASFDPKLGDEVVVTVIAAGLPATRRVARRVAASKDARPARARATSLAASAVPLVPPPQPVAETPPPFPVESPAAPGRPAARVRTRRAPAATARPRRGAPRPATSVGRPSRSGRGRGVAKMPPAATPTAPGAAEHDSFDLPSFLRSRIDGPRDGSAR